MSQADREENAKLVSVDQEEEWNRFVTSCGGYDVYHLAEFHRMALSSGEGRPLLFTFSSHGHRAALPFLIRPLSEVEGLGNFRENDATSVYGYPGLLASLEARDPGADDFRTGFQKALKKALESESVIAFFSRQHPILDSSWLMEGLAQVVKLGFTVAIDLRRPDGEQTADMTKGHRYDVRKLERTGAIVRDVGYLDSLDKFMAIYNETMDRAQASEFYRFSRQYFMLLKKNLDGAVRMYVAEIDGNIVAASIFLVSDRIIQYHLSGSPTTYSSLSGAKAIIDHMRRWGSSQGYWWLHLGGGVGSSSDSLFRFKSGFSSNRLPFKIIKWVLDSEVYDDALGLSKSPATSFFPAYRTASKASRPE